MASPLKYGRALLKVTGAAFGGDGEPLSRERVSYIAQEIAAAREAGAEVAVVVGGGNLIRGRTAGSWNWPRATVDYMGMLATVVNGLALRECLLGRGVGAAALSAFAVGECCERYRPGRAQDLLAAGNVVIFVGGTGRPFFTTDTAAALRACEVGAQVLLKATDVAGVYDRDPHEHPDATRFERLSYDEVLGRRLKVMDGAAVALCRENNIPVAVFNLYEPGNIVKIIKGENVGTLVG